MLIIFGLMLVLLQTASCLERICSFIKTEPCYAALGDKLSLQMVQYINISKLDLMKEESAICKIKNNIIIKSGLYSNRSDIIISNGTVIINSATRSDSGNYTLQLYDSVGKHISPTGLQVNVEAPIGSVKVSVNCISEQWVVTCSSKGDSLFFSWTLNGQPLPQETKTSINLNGKTSGNITCRVGNHISHGEKSITVNYCPGTTTASVTTHLTSTVTNSTSAGTTLSGSTLTPTQNPGLFASLNLKPKHLIAMASSIVILILLVITVCYIYKRKKHPKSAAGEKDNLSHNTPQRTRRPGSHDHQTAGVT